jgi:serine/threonine protein kinase
VNQIGRGTTATVHRAMDTSTLQLLALKNITMDTAGHWRTLYTSEVRTLQALAESEHVPCLLACKAYPELAKATLCMRLMNLGNADQWARTRHRPCPEPWLAHVAYSLLQVRRVGGPSHVACTRVRRRRVAHVRACPCIAIHPSPQALEVVHLEGVHRDVKPGNILLDYSSGRMTVMLSDFGISTNLIAADAAERPRMCSSPSSRGTLQYMAPERLQMEGSGEAADVWSLGLTIATLANGGEPPLSGSTSCFDRVDVAVNAVSILCDPSCVDESCLTLAYHPSPELRSFLAAMLCCESTDRSTLAVLKTHPFMSQRLAWQDACPEVMAAAVSELERTRNVAAVNVALHAIVERVVFTQHGSLLALAICLGIDVLDLIQD